MGWEQHAFRDVSDRPDPEPIRCLLLGPPEVDTHALVLAMAQTSSMKIDKIADGRVELPPNTKPSVSVALVPARTSTSDGTPALPAAVEIWFLPWSGPRDGLQQIVDTAHVIIIAMDDSSAGGGLEGGIVDGAGRACERCLDLLEDSPNGNRGDLLFVPVAVRSDEARGLLSGRGADSDSGVDGDGRGGNSPAVVLAAREHMVRRLDAHGKVAMEIMAVNVRSREGASQLTRLVATGVLPRRLARGAKGEGTGAPSAGGSEGDRPPHGF
eukprot:CAMPEP_0182530454 /NCGR_PEP_ID=MMETSP1323-20130603/5923_1 /TAXON_ID=236787 /ORGANISM="Florenciella parvula, Strain RCC1693" /LENGTH=268 /DNA_ID=CAMNT_0024739753 /DNA_START=14 /DNA_END=821 /DNA_ORIENTATION=+